MNKILWLISIGLLTVTLANCTTISSVNSLFEIFSPKSLVRFFEFSDQGWNITNGCIKDMYIYLDGLQKEKIWALKLYDASSYYSGGFYGGVYNRYTQPANCRALNKEKTHYYTNEENFENLNIYNENVLPFNVTYSNAKYEMTLMDDAASNAHTQIIQSICMPKSCNLYDLSQVLSYNNISKSDKLMQEVDLVELRTLNDDDYSLVDDKSFHVIIVLTFFSIILLSSASIYEYFYTSSKKKSIPKVHTTNEARKFSVNSLALKHLATIGVEEELKATSILSSNYGTLSSETLSDELSSRATSAMGDSMTNFHPNNYAEVNKLKPDKMISLDIISANCYNAFILQQKNSLKKGHTNHEVSENFVQFSHNFHMRSIFEATSSHVNSIDEIGCIHGIKTLCWLGVVMAHVTTFLFFVGDNAKFNEKYQKKGFYYFVYQNGSYSVDTYFFLSGITLYYTFYNSTKDMNIEKFGGVFKQFFQYSTIIVLKLLKLTLPYAVVLHSLSIAMKYFDDNSVIEIPSNDHEACEENIWRNLLYVDVFRPYSERCMPWAWYISVEVQFFIAGSLLLMISRNHQHYATIIFASFYISSVITTVLIKVYSQSKTSWQTEEEVADFNGIYSQPWVRIGPYIVGIFFGYFLKRHSSKISYKQSLTSAGWCLIGVMTISLFLAQNLSNEVNIWIRSSLTTISHTVWAIILVWLIYMSISDENGSINAFLSMKCFYPLSKLSNCIFLIHPLVTRYIILGSNAAIHLTNEIILTYFLGFTVLILCAAFLLHYFFEAPALVFLSIVYKKILLKIM